MNPGVDRYLTEGCGRCALGGTPACKVNFWPEELVRLRKILLDSGLNETIKWGMPCYTWSATDGPGKEKNIVMLAAFKEYCSLSFFKGSLLKDDNNILSKPGENSQAARLIKFKGVAEIIKLERILASYIQEAIEVEKAGRKVKFKDISGHEVPAELEKKLKAMPALNSAFNALTPGRQRGYLLYFSAPKQSSTREARIEKCVPLILSGKGLHDR